MEEIRHYRGIWKFGNKVSVEDLEALAREWAEDENYLSLCLRKCSKDQWGVDFEYKNPNGDDRAGLDRYFEDVSDTLRRRFGNGLAGWDISVLYYKIK